MYLQFAPGMKSKSEVVVVVDFFGGGFGQKASLIKNQQNMKNGSASSSNFLVPN